MLEVIPQKFHDSIPFGVFCDTLSHTNITLLWAIREMCYDYTSMGPESFSEYLFKELDCINGTFLGTSR